MNKLRKLSAYPLTFIAMLYGTLAGLRMPEMLSGYHTEHTNSVTLGLILGLLICSSFIASLIISISHGDNHDK